jgi:hypothetical protein
VIDVEAVLICVTFEKLCLSYDVVLSLLFFFLVHKFAMVTGFLA